MKLVILLMVSCLMFSAQAKSPKVGDFVEYNVQKEGCEDEGLRVEITKLSHADWAFGLKLRGAWNEDTNIDKWVLACLESPKSIVKNCHRINYAIKTEYLNIRGRMIKTCKIDMLFNNPHSAAFLDGYDLSGGNVWIGEGPYNGILKAKTSELSENQATFTVINYGSRK